jgi:polysaccharide export outer membrane protein
MPLASAAAQQTPQTISSVAQPETSPKPARDVASADSQPVDSNSPAGKAYMIGEDDQLDVNVWKEKEISRSVTVRTDGKITLPLIGEIRASGMTPLQLQENIGQRLKAFLANPAVTVIVTDPRSHHYNVVGQVAKPGIYPLSQLTTVLDAISSAGGFRDFARETKIYILRKLSDGTQTKLPFNYKDVIKGKTPASNIVLQSGDIIVVP